MAEWIRGRRDRSLHQGDPSQRSTRSLHLSFFTSATRSTPTLLPAELKKMLEAVVELLYPTFAMRKKTQSSRSKTHLITIDSLTNELPYKPGHKQHRGISNTH